MEKREIIFLKLEGETKKISPLDRDIVIQPQREGTFLHSKLSALLRRLILCGNTSKVKQSCLACNHNKRHIQDYRYSKVKNVRSPKNSDLEPCVDYLKNQKIDLTEWLQ